LQPVRRAERPQNEMEAGIAAGLHCPWVVGPARRRDRLSQGGSGRGLAAPVGPSGSFAGILLFRFRFLRVPRPALRPASVPWRVPSFFRLAASNSGSLSDADEAKLLRVLSRYLPPGGFRDRRTLEGKWVRLWLAPPPRASSFRLPGPRFLRFRFLRTSAAFRLAVPGSVYPFPEGRALPHEGHWHRIPIRPSSESDTCPVDNGDSGDNMD
jgi:hypothetical protein